VLLHSSTLSTPPSFVSVQGLGAQDLATYDHYPTFIQPFKSSSMARTRLFWQYTSFIRQRSLPLICTHHILYGSWEKAYLQARSLHLHSFPGSLGKDLSLLQHFSFFTSPSFGTHHTLSSNRLGNDSPYTRVPPHHFLCYQSPQSPSAGHRRVGYSTALCLGGGGSWGGWGQSLMYSSVWIRLGDGQVGDAAHCARATTSPESSVAQF
jgi:hypothetical protein